MIGSSEGYWDANGLGTGDRPRPGTRVTIVGGPYTGKPGTLTSNLSANRRATKQQLEAVCQAPGDTAMPP